MALLFFTVFNSILGLTMLFPIFGPLGRELGLSEPEIGALSTSYALMQLALSPYWGKKSETAGRKRVLLIGVAGFALGFLLLGAVSELGRAGVIRGVPLIAALIAARLIGGAFSSAMIPTAQAFAADLTDRSDRTAGMAVIGAAFGLALIFGPATGGVVGHLFGLTALGSANALLVISLLREPARRERTAGDPRSSTLREVGLRAWPLLVVASVITTATVLMEQTIAFLIEDRLGLARRDTPLFIGGGLLVYGIVAVAVQGGLVRRVKIAPRTLLMIGMPITITGLLTLMMSASYPVMVAGMALQGLGQGLVLPGVTSALSLSVTDHEQGAIAGLSNGAQGLGRLLAPLIGTTLYRLGQSLPYATGAALLAIALAIVIAAAGITERRPVAR
jgi:MFS family permease